MCNRLHEVGMAARRVKTLTELSVKDRTGGVVGWREANSGDSFPGPNTNTLLKENIDGTC